MCACVCLLWGGGGEKVTEYTGWTEESLFLFHLSINNNINQSHDWENRIQSVSVTSGCVSATPPPPVSMATGQLCEDASLGGKSRGQRVSRTALRSVLRHLFKHADFNNLSRLLLHSSITDVLSTLQCLIQQSPSAVPAC